MTRSTAYRSWLIHIAAGALAAALALLPQAAFGQRGGGHSGGGGGGHFGGGGGHSGGGSHAPVQASSARRGNSASSAAPVSHSAGASSGPTSAGSPGNMARFADSSGAIHGGGVGAGSVAFRNTTIGFPPSSTGNWPSAYASSSSSHEGPLSFSGQGHELWRNSTSPIPVTNPSAVHAQEGFSEAARGFRSFPSPPHVISGPTRFYPFAFYPGFGYFGPGFGFLGYGGGFGFGFGCDPLWNFDCDAFGPGYGYGYGGGYGNYNLATESIQADSSSDASSVDYGGPSVWRNPPTNDSGPESGDTSGSSAPQSSSTAAGNSYTVIYLQDGTSFAVADYWVAEGKLHYVTSYGGENAVDLNQFDIERTTEENATRGVTVTLRGAAAQNAPTTPPTTPRNSSTTAPDPTGANTPEPQQ
jgi:hypothetical protein